MSNQCGGPKLVNRVVGARCASGENMHLNPHSHARIHLACAQPWPLEKRPRSTETSSVGGFRSPGNNNSTLQSKTVLIVVVVADRERALVAKAGIEILSLDGAKGNFLG